MRTFLIFVIHLVLFDSFSSIAIEKDDLNNPKPWPPNYTVCYDVEGCFSNSYPFNNSGNFLPTTPEFLNTEFLLFTPKNPDSEDELSYKNLDTIRNSKFDANLPLKLIIHGFGNTRNTSWMYRMKNSILNKEKSNVIIVAWGNGCTFPLYANSSSNTRLVGKQIGLLINSIRSLLYSSNSRGLMIHCIGHSLGAHICGYASNAGSIRFNRISALDPAGPNFENYPPIVRIDTGDADFVDVWHTNGNQNGLLAGAFGTYSAIGHVDFYINGGYYQAGCPVLNDLIGSLINGNLNPSTDVGCSHNRVISLFIESISTSCSFTAYSCVNQTYFNNGECLSCENNKCATMSYNSNEFNNKGVMFVNTNSKSPYCGFNNIFELKINDESKTTAGDLTIKINSNENSFKILSNENILMSSTVKKLIISSKPISSINSFEMTFVRKPPLFNWLPNPYPDTFIMDKIKFQNSDSKIFSQCSKRTLITTGIVKTFTMSNDDCQL